MDRAKPLRVELVFCPRPGQTDLVVLALPAGACVADALQACDLVAHYGWVPECLQLGIWSRRCELTTPLRDRDRVEIYRPLMVDPKEARRLRYKGQRAKPQKPKPAG